MSKSPFDYLKQISDDKNSNNHLTLDDFLHKIKCMRKIQMNEFGSCPYLKFFKSPTTILFQIFIYSSVKERKKEAGKTTISIEHTKELER